jgi:hypothetical protein
MKKKLFILMLISISCRASYGNTNKTLVVQKDNISEMQEIDSIIGTWEISKSISTETKHEKGNVIKTESAIVCNVCSTIIFKKCGEGILRNAVGDESSFNWFICKDKIYFSFEKKKDEKEFFSLDKEFRFKIHHDSKFYYLELIQKKEGDKYILIR